MTYRRLLTTVLLTPILCARPAGAADTHPFSVHDMLAMERISDHQVSPDGTRIVFVLRTTDLDANRGRTDLWLVNADGSGLRRLTAHPDADGNPRWSPDGRTIWFISSRSGSSQVWRIAVDGGEAEQVTRQPLDVSNLVLSRDGRRIAFTMDVFPESSPEETKKKLDDVATRKATGRIYDRLFVRHWDAWKDGRRSHLFVMPADGGETVDVTKGMDADVPTKPFGGPEEITFTPDGKALIFTARNAGPMWWNPDERANDAARARAPHNSPDGEAWSTNGDLFLVAADGSSAPRCLTPRNPAMDTQPVFSPDGKTLAWLAMSRPGYEADKHTIWVRSWPDGAPRALTENWDCSASEIAWSSDGRTIYTTADYFGQHSLFAIEVETGEVKLVSKDGSHHGPQSAGDAIVAARDDLLSPAELFRFEPGGGQGEPVTRINAERCAAARLCEPEQFTFMGWNNENVYGYVVQPVDFDPAKRYPVAFLIHGGPQGSFGN